MLNKLFTKNYNKYLRIAENILRVSKHDISIASDLLNECYLYMVNKDIDGDDSYLESVIVNWMNKQVKWNKTDFNKMNTIKDNFIKNFDYDEKETILSNIEWIEYEEDEHETMLEYIHQRSRNLDAMGKRLYNLSIIGEYNNSGRLSRYSGLNRTTCYYMIRDLKIYLRDGYND
jgi:hypothetical protein